MADKLSEMISTSLDSIKTIADTGTIVGDPIPTNNGTVIIPVSKVSLGFASGGLDYVSKNAEKAGKPSIPCFGGGGGSGVSITPICFLVVKEDGSVSMLDIANPAAVPTPVGVIDSISSLADKTPELISKIKAIFAKKKPNDEMDDDKLKEELNK